MKRYALFAGQTYYPAGGWQDFIDAFDTMVGAEAAYILRNGEDDWYHIVDIESGERVNGEGQAHSGLWGLVNHDPTKPALAALTR